VNVHALEGSDVARRRDARQRLFAQLHMCGLCRRSFAREVAVFRLRHAIRDAALKYRCGIVDTCDVLDGWKHSLALRVSDALHPRLLTCVYDARFSYVRICTGLRTTTAHSRLDPARARLSAAEKLRFKLEFQLEAVFMSSQAGCRTGAVVSITLILLPGGRAAGVMMPTLLWYCIRIHGSATSVVLLPVIQ
jgi:hypothetical protein